MRGTTSNGTWHFNVLADSGFSWFCAEFQAETVVIRKVALGVSVFIKQVPNHLVRGFWQRSQHL